MLIFHIYAIHALPVRFNHDIVDITHTNNEGLK
jgi:hypothetical protein